MRALEMVKKYAMQRVVSQMASLLARGSDDTLVRLCSLADKA